MTLGPLTPPMAAQIRQLEASDKTEPIDRAYLNLLYGVQQLDDVPDLFMTITETLLAELETAIQHHDICIVRHMVHEIKGSSYTVSAREMARVCRELEKAGEEQNWPEIEKLYVALAQIDSSSDWKTRLKQLLLSTPANVLPSSLGFPDRWEHSKFWST